MGQLFRWCEILVLDVQKGIRCPVSDANHVQTASEVVCMFCVTGYTLRNTVLRKKMSVCI